MKAAVFRGVRQPLAIEDVQLSAPGPHEVIIRTAAAGVCHSDVHFYEGLYPTPTPVVLGHESAGIVEEVGSEVRYVAPGDHVITCLSVFCGHCDYCTTGRPHLCNREGTRREAGQAPRLSQNGEVVHQFADLSSYAEQLLVHEHAVVKVRDLVADAFYRVETPLRVPWVAAGGAQAGEPAIELAADGAREDAREAVAPPSMPSGAAPVVGVPTGEYVNGVAVHRLPSINVTASRSEELAKMARE